MSKSFYQKEGLDFLYFQRPGTAYNNPAAFGKDSENKVMSMMGTATRSQFFSGSSGAMKPIELIKSRQHKQSSVLQTLWQERANRTLQQMNHIGLLIDQFEYMYEVADRMKNETIPNLKQSSKEETQTHLPVKKDKQSHVHACQQFLELYQTFTITDYDYWDYKNFPVFSLFIEKFESQAQELEHKASQLILGVYSKPEGKSGKLNDPYMFSV
jgi:hypothetical protein